MILLVCSNQSQAVLEVSSIQHIRISCSSDSTHESLGEISVSGASCNPSYILIIEWFGPNSYSSTGATISSLSDPGLYRVTYKCVPTKWCVGCSTLFSGDTLDVYLGYQLEYTDFGGGVNEVYSSTSIALENVASNSWCRGASSENILKGSTDGWIQYIPPSTTVHRYIGFRTWPGANHCGVNDATSGYGLYLVSGGSLRKVEKGSQTTIGTYAANDVLWVEYDHTDGKVYYYKNGVQLSSSSPNFFSFQIQDKRVEARIWTSGQTIDNVATSFKPPFDVNITVNNIPCGRATGGSISLDPCGTGSYTYDWNYGPTTSSVSNLTKGQYYVTIEGANNWMYKKTISVGYDPEWTDLYEVTHTGTSLEKTSGTNSWHGGAQSSSVLPISTDGWFEFEVAEATKLKAIGFSDNPSSPYGTADIDFGLRLENDSSRYLFELGSTIGNPISIDPKDRIRISKEGSNYKFYFNDYLFSTRSITNQSYHLAVVFNEVGGVLGSTSVSWNCDSMPQPLARLEKEPDGANVAVFQDRLSIVYEEPYDVGANKSLNYRIYNEARALVAGVNAGGTALVSGSPVVDLAYGINHYTLFLHDLSLPSGKYLLEVTTPKDEKLYLRFELI